ncbi:hypothetical protein ACHAXM_006583 [Skeletonema potamos]
MFVTHRTRNRAEERKVVSHLSSTPLHQPSIHCLSMMEPVVISLSVMTTTFADERGSETTPPCTISRYALSCGVCEQSILPGDKMFCFGKTTTKASSISWGHESCHRVNLPPPPICRHWMRLGRCPSLQANLCAFRHPQNERGTQATLEKQRWGGRRHYTRNQHKNSVFRIFLMQTYGMDYLNRHNGVIVDAAGGKGELAWELINLSGVEECVVVDPRELNLSLVQTKWKKGLFEPKRTGPVFSKWYPACEDGYKTRQSKSPRHIRCFLDGESCLEFMNASSEEDVHRADEWYQAQLLKAKEISWTSKGLTQHEDGTSYDEEEVTNNDETVTSSSDTIETATSEISSAQEARMVLKKCHLIIGLHCDQAAGEIVDFASAQKIPWAVVPCCTYAEMFTGRKLSDGTRVTSYDHLVQWLQEGDPRAKVATLDMEGKNKVVYTLP